MNEQQISYRNSINAAAKIEMVKALDKIMTTYGLTDAEANACLIEILMSQLMAQLREERATT